LLVDLRDVRSLLLYDVDVFMDLVGNLCPSLRILIRSCPVHDMRSRKGSRSFKGGWLCSYRLIVSWLEPHLDYYSMHMGSRFLPRQKQHEVNIAIIDNITATVFLPSTRPIVLPMLFCLEHGIPNIPYFLKHSNLNIFPKHTSIQRTPSWYFILVNIVICLHPSEELLYLDPSGVILINEIRSDRQLAIVGKSRGLRGH